MANNFSLFILGLLLAVPYLNAAPTTSSEEEIIPKPAIERLKILLLTLDEFVGLFVDLSTLGPDVFKAVLEDPNVTADKSEENQKYLKELRDYVEKSEKAKNGKDSDEAFDLLDEYSDIVNKFDSDKNKDLSPAALAIEKSLEENGLEKIQEKIQERFVSFIAKLNAEIEEYSKDLNEKEKEQDKEFLEWAEKLKSEKDIAKQIELFDNFIEVDSSEETVA